MTRLHLIGLAAVAWLTSFPVLAVTTADGVVLINQTAALAGNVTPGDAAGFPIEIKAGGSYRLSSDLKVPTGVDGISVTVRNVSIDLNGFSMRGGNIAKTGIRSPVGGLTVRNGTIQFFTQDGINTAGPQLRVEDMKITNNARSGIYDISEDINLRTLAEDGNTIIRNNIIMQNQDGIFCLSGCHLEGNVISHQGNHGAVIGDGNSAGSMAINNTIVRNARYGIVGDYIGLGGNTIMFNGICHTNGLMFVMEKNAVYPASGENCLPLPGN